MLAEAPLETKSDNAKPINLVIVPDGIEMDVRKPAKVVFIRTLTEAEEPYPKRELPDVYGEGSKQQLEAFIATKGHQLWAEELDDAPPDGYRPKALEIGARRIAAVFEARSKLHLVSTSTNNLNFLDTTATIEAATPPKTQLAPTDKFIENAPDPQDLVQRASQRDTEAFATLYEQHVNSVYRFVLFKVGDATLAEDLTSEVFSKAWESIERFRWRNLPFQHWLIKIGRNMVVDYWRANRRPISNIDGLFDMASKDPPPDERVATGLDVESLSRALAELPDDQRDVIILRYIEGYSHKEVGVVMGKSEVATRQIQVRALDRLKKIMSVSE